MSVCKVICFVALLSLSNMLNAQLVIKGDVVDAGNNEPIPGATVLEVGTSNGTITDFDGKFSLQVQQGAKLRVSFIGMLTVETLATPGQSMRILLKPEMEKIDEVMVVGYGAKKRRDVIGSVASVTAEDLAVAPATSLTSALQGKAAGVQITTSSGVPGSQVNIRIRGENSISINTSPLWIIDGMPVYSGGGLEKTVGSTSQDPLSMINPNDIESVQILKDAAATSIYGSRGSNGVVLVTTKSGKKGVSSTNVDYSTGITMLNRKPEDIGFANTTEWFSLVDQARANSGLSPFDPKDITKFFKDSPLAQISRDQAMLVNTDWFDQILRTGSFQEINASSSGGSEKGTYFLSVNYSDTKSVLKENYFDKFSIRSNVEFSPVEHLKIGTRLNLSYTNNTRVAQQVAGATGNNSGGASAGWGSANRGALPWFPIFNASHPSGYWNPMSGANLVAAIDPRYHRDEVEQYRGIGNVFLNYNVPFVKGLTLRSEASGDVIVNNSVFWVNQFLRENGSYAVERSALRRSFNYNVYGNYDRTFAKDHNVQATFGAEWQTIDQYVRDMAGQNLKGNYQQIGSPMDYLEIYGGLNFEEYLSGFIGRFDYKFKDRYIVGVSLRRDGSSKFLADRRWQTFTAWSAGWIISDEPFFNLPSVNMLKLRGSFGQTGNKDIPSNLFETTFSNDRLNRYGDAELISGGSRIENLGMPTLTWETTNSYDVGVDFGLFENRVSGSLAYYLQDVTDLLLQSKLPPSVGVGVLWNNIGDMRNYGLEFNVSSTNIHKPVHKFKWTTDFNISYNKNKVMQLTPMLDRQGRGVERNGTISVKDGSLWAWYMCDYAGVDPDKGVDMIHEIDYDLWQNTGKTVKTGRLVPATQTNLERNRFIHESKTRVPVFSGGMTNRFSFKNLDLMFHLSFAAGHYLYDYEEQRSTSVQYGQVVLRKDLLGNTWEKPGDVAKYPQLVWDSQYPWGWDVNAPNPDWTGDPNDPKAKGTWLASNGTQTYGYNNQSSYYSKHLYRGDYVRLQTLQLGYTFSNALLTKVGMKGLRLNATATNLFLWTAEYNGWDPETGGGVLPPPRIFSVGVSANF